MFYINSFQPAGHDLVFPTKGMASWSHVVTFVNFQLAVKMHWTLAYSWTPGGLSSCPSKGVILVDLCLIIIWPLNPDILVGNPSHTEQPSAVRHPGFAKIVSIYGSWGPAAWLWPLAKWKPWSLQFNPRIDDVSILRKKNTQTTHQHGKHQLFNRRDAQTGSLSQNGGVTCHTHNFGGLETQTSRLWVNVEAWREATAFPHQPCTKP